MDTKQYVREHGITADTVMVDDNPNMDDDRWKADANHWKVTLRFERRQLTTYFSTGVALGEPTAADVLDCLASDASGYYSAQGFEDWASEYGYDTDSIKVLRTYHTIGRQAKRLLRFLGAIEYENLIDNVERL